MSETIKLFQYILFKKTKAISELIFLVNGTTYS